MPVSILTHRNAEDSSRRGYRAMVDEEIRDGARIFEMLAAELAGHNDPPFDEIRLMSGGEPVERGVPSERAGSIEYQEERLCEVSVEEDRVSLSLFREQDAIAAAPEEEGLPVRPSEANSTQTCVFVERGVDVKRVIDVFGRSLPHR